MYCPKCHSPVEKARLDVWWCKYCQTTHMIHKLSYKSLEEASEISDDEYMKQTHIQNIIGHYDNSDKIAFPPKPR